MKQGIDNFMSVEDVASIFEKLYHGALISKDASEKMLALMTQHQKTQIMPDLFKEKIMISHMTSIDDWEIADCGIIYAEKHSWELLYIKAYTSSSFMKGQMFLPTLFSAISTAKWMFRPPRRPSLK